MPRLSLTRILAAIAVIFAVTGCTTTSQPVAQANSSTAAKKYYSEETPQTGSHIARRYAADDPNKPADNSGYNNSTPILASPTLSGPKVAPGGN